MMTENEIVEFLKQSFGDKILEIESPRERRIFSRIKQEDLKILQKKQLQKKLLQKKLQKKLLKQKKL